MNTLPPVSPSAPLFALPATARGAVRLVLCSALSALAGVATVSMLSGPNLHAQASRAGLISQTVNESDRVVLSGNTHPLATRAADRGAVSPDMPADRMLLLLKRSPESESTLRSTIEALHNRNSPSFHKWLTPAQFGTQFGVADSDIATVTAWLQSHGFKVQGATAGRTAIEFSGTAGQIQQAFHTSIHSYQVQGEMHHANSTDPQIPAALAPVVAGISTLNDFHPRSMAKKGPRGIYDLKSKKARPELTATGSSGDFLYVGPADAATIYNSPIRALNPAATGNTVDGTGATIAIIGDSNISVDQNANYRKLFGLAAKAPTVIVDGGVDPGENGDAVEAYLDTEVANGIAPGAKLYFYTAADSAVNYGLDLAALRAVNDNLADVLSVSFGLCEGALYTQGNQFYESIWEQAAAQGISVTVSTGDAGSAGCDDENTQTLATYGLQVNGLASTPFNIAVGGTDFAALAGPDGFGRDFGNYVSSNNDPKTLRSAKTYIPEVPWNDSINNFPPGPISGTEPFPDPNANIIAAGGGKSNCSVGGLTGSGSLACTSGYAKPSWQSPPLTPNDHARDLPDVSLFAANGLYYAAWGICTDQDQLDNGQSIHDCTPGSDGLPADEFYISGVGGTSASAPAFAGILALVRQSTGERQGQADYVLYNLARTAPGSFHDVVTGNNSVPCQAGTPDCAKNAAGAYYLTGYDAGTGFDLATGLGSLDASALIANWASAGLAATTTTLDVNPASFQHGTPVVVGATVTSAAGIPTGDVALTASANPPSFPKSVAIGTIPLSGDGSAVETLNDLPGGSYQIRASYGGSAEFAQSVSAPKSVTVTPEPSKTQVIVSAFNPVSGLQITNGNFPYGYYQGFSARPYGVNSPTVGGVLQPDGIATGYVSFSGGSVDLGTVPIGSNGFAESINHMLSAGAYTVKAAYPGDNSFGPSFGTQPVTVTKALTSLSMTASATKYSGKPLVFTVSLTTESVGAAPTGTVALMSGATILAQTPLVGVAATASSLAGGTATISTSNLPTAASEIRAVYVGDSNYAASTSNQIEIAGKPTFTISNVSMTLPGEHTTGAALVAVVSEGGYAGTVKLTCTLVTKTSTKTPPLCAFNPTSVPLTAGETRQPVILIYGVGTKVLTGTTTGSNAKWLGTGGAVLAACLLLGIPARRRGWRAMLSAILLLVALGGFTACVSTPKMITAGTYTFKVVGTDSTDSTNTATATVTVRVL
jgi:hypothetical protein